jgi:hypothetical protein
MSLFEKNEERNTLDAAQIQRKRKLDEIIDESVEESVEQSTKESTQKKQRTDESDYQNVSDGKPTSQPIKNTTSPSSSIKYSYSTGNYHPYNTYNNVNKVTSMGSSLGAPPQFTIRPLSDSFRKPLYAPTSKIPGFQSSPSRTPSSSSGVTSSSSGGTSNSSGGTSSSSGVASSTSGVASSTSSTPSTPSTSSATSSTSGVASSTSGVASSSSGASVSNTPGFQSSPSRTTSSTSSVTLSTSCVASSSKDVVGTSGTPAKTSEVTFDVSKVKIASCEIALADIKDRYLESMYVFSSVTNSLYDQILNQKTLENHEMSILNSIKNLESELKNVNYRNSELSKKIRAFFEKLNKKSESNKPDETSGTDVVFNKLTKDAMKCKFEAYTIESNIAKQNAALAKVRKELKILNDKINQNRTKYNSLV